MTKLGIIGLGFGQHVHIPAFRLDPRCSIQAVCSQRIETAKEVALALGVPGYYSRFSDLIMDPEIDAVSIAVPPAEQPQIVEFALKNKKHVFLEKPLGGGSENGRKLLELTKAFPEVAHMIDFEFTDLPVWQEAKRLLGKGVLGSLTHVSVNWHVKTAAHDANPGSWKLNPAKGGGTLNNFSSHVFYYLEWLLGPITGLNAQLDDRDFSALIQLDFSLGCSGVASLSSNSPYGGSHRIEFWGTAGYMKVENTGKDYVNGFRISLESKYQGNLASLDQGDANISDGRVVAVARLAKRFLDWIETGAPQRPDLGDALRVETLLDLARKSNSARAWQDTRLVSNS